MPIFKDDDDDEDNDENLYIGGFSKKRDSEIATIPILYAFSGKFVPK